MFYLAKGLAYVWSLWRYSRSRTAHCGTGIGLALSLIAAFWLKRHGALPHRFVLLIPDFDLGDSSVPVDRNPTEIRLIKRRIE